MSPGKLAAVDTRREVESFSTARQPLAAILAGVSYFLVVLLFQRVLGAPQAAFGGYPDESSHYISGLFVHDYLASGSLTSPIRYAKDYYTHIPFFAVGYWPPLFYLVEALWMQCFGVSRAAMLALVAAIAGGCATQVFVCLRDEFGKMAAWGAGLLFLLFPIVLWSSGLVMTDLPVTLFSFAAALALASYLNSGRMVWIFAFWLLATMAILSKSSGAFLVVVPVAAVLASGRLGLLKRISFWVAPLVAAVLYAPWLLLTRKLLGLGFAGFTKPGLLTTLTQFGAGLLENLLWLTPLVLIGAWVLTRGPRPMTGLAAVCLVQPVAVVAFLAVAPVGNEPRYLTPALPLLLILAMYGLRRIAGWVAPRRAVPVMTGVVALLAGSFAAYAALRVRPVAEDPFRSIASFVIERGYHSVLVPSDAEGPMIADISERKQSRLAGYMVRPSKLLARINWDATTYQARYRTKEETQALFDQFPLDAVIVRTNPPTDALQHEVLLYDAVVAFPNRWRLARSFTNAPSAANYAVYEPVKLTELSDQDLGLTLRDLLSRQTRALTQ